MNKFVFTFLLAGILMIPAASFGKISKVRLESMMELSSQLNSFTAQSPRPGGNGIAMLAAALMIMPEFSQCDVLCPVIFYYFPGHELVFSCHLRPGIKVQPIFRKKETLYPFTVSGRQTVFAPDKSIADRIKTYLQSAEKHSDAIISADLSPDKYNTAFLARLASRDRAVSASLESLLHQTSGISLKLKFPQKDTVSFTMQIEFVKGTPAAAFAGQSFPAKQIKNAFVLQDRTGISVFSLPMSAAMKEKSAIFLEKVFQLCYKNHALAAAAADIVRAASGTAVLSSFGDSVLMDIPLQSGKKIRLPEDIFIKSGNSLCAAIGRKKVFLQFREKSLLLFFTRRDTDFPAMKNFDVRVEKNNIMQTYLTSCSRTEPFSWITIRNGKIYIEARAKNTMQDSIVP